MGIIDFTTLPEMIWQKELRAHRLVRRQIRFQTKTVIVAILIQIFTRCSLETSCEYCCFGPSHAASVPTSSLSVVEHLRSGAFVYFSIWPCFWGSFCGFYHSCIVEIMPLFPFSIFGIRFLVFYSKNWPDSWCNFVSEVPVWCSFGVACVKKQPLCVFSP